ncbi:hypothetical protein AWZ03_005404 [Drosophila navojoa]|uniref:CHK kinase-like domain-containing protein n=1 Tax=Drosophila navojoa TaxID=7232 RepID=A0A484BHH8_DRONA|nr:uncharacterized protein LOC108660167 [Drosophila navojoa]TDG48229.1 hypothetical protein AWZ03_005404 [Drosophila navojoa]
MAGSDLPCWLTKDYLQTQLRAYHKDPQLNVRKLWSNAAVGKGQNYVGVVTRIHVEYELTGGAVEQRTYFLKEGCPDDAPQAGMFAEYGVYTREMDMYEFILPRMQQLLREVGIEDKLHAHAVCIDREHGIMLLEDLTPLRYQNADRVKQLDLPHTQLTLQMLAKFHAAALMLRQQQPELFAQGFTTSFFSRGPQGYSKVFTNLFKGLMRYVKTQPKLAACYYGKLERLLVNLMEYAARVFDVTDDDFQVLTHGDCWTTNIMFQYDANEQPIAVLPIDFQFSTLGPPVLDLHYFFCTSLREEVLARETELVQYYYYALKRALGQFNYEGKVPSLMELQLQFERRRFLCVIIGLVFQPLMIYNGNDCPDFCKLYMDTPEAISFQDSVYEGVRAQRIVAKLLPFFDARGLLDEQ